jgi:hypothetical protein
MIECPLREGYQKALRRYEQSSDLAYLVKALSILDKSTPPSAQEERIPWVNDLIDSYRQVSKAFQGEIKVKGDSKESAEEDSKERVPRRDVKIDLMRFKEYLDEGKYDGAIETLSNLLEDTNNASGKNIIYAREVISAYDELVEKMQKKAEAAKLEIEELEEEVEKAKGEIENIKFKPETTLRKIGDIR